MTGRTSKGEATRQEILRVAASAFARRGYAGTRMDDVIRESGLTKGAIYFHFPSKEELAGAVVDDHKQRWLTLGRAEIDRHDNPVAKLEALGA
ncbi:MAG: transcriptional regulator, partial [Frondihabitans sp.]|nr:transcriptional regulator [Frondihabitans sp.]